MNRDKTPVGELKNLTYPAFNHLCIPSLDGKKVFSFHYIKVIFGMETAFGMRMSWGCFLLDDR